MGAAAQSCPTVTCKRSGTSGACSAWDNDLRFSCPTVQWQKHITSYPGTWWKNVTATELTPLEYVSSQRPCCRHCAWSLGYPLVVPQVMAISPNQDFCAGTTVGFSLCFLDCTKWPGDYNQLDKDLDGFLNATEFTPYFTDYFVAPSQNFKLYTGGGIKYNADLSRLDPTVILDLLDLNKDSKLSLAEYSVFRHFWSPVFVSKAGPSLVPSDGRTLADGPLGGMFLDQSFLEIWQTNQVNMMLEYYTTPPRNNTFMSFDIRPPVTTEKNAIMSSLDIDGSKRISNEEAYFRKFADKNGDNELSETEFYQSLYKTDCQPHCPRSGCLCRECPVNGIVAADCPVGGRRGAATASEDGVDKRSNFQLHDLDEDGKITFMERKFVAADVNKDRMIDEDEWRIGDFPEIYGPYQGHCLKGDTTCFLDVTRYRYYLSFHNCASRGSLAYNAPISEYPWSPACKMLVQVEAMPPFIEVELFTSPADKAAKEAAGFVCYPADADQAADYCFGGFAFKSFYDVSVRLKWVIRPVVVAGGVLSVDNLPPPAIIGNGAGAAVFQMGLFTSYQIPWSQSGEHAPDDFWCSDSLWKDDGLVVVKRTNEAETSIEFAILRMVIGPAFINFVVFCYFAVLLTGHIFWLIERGNNPELFDPSYTVGAADGLWFSMVTVTTVGYGDKVPMTGLGKSVTIIWMFFGILCFGVFSGQVSEQISTAAAENSIKGPLDLGGFKVGVLKRLAEPVVAGMNLGASYNFEQVLCEDEADCEQKLLVDQSISAMIIPHSDMVGYFKSTGAHLKKCGNPMMIVGKPFTTTETEKWTKHTVKLCSYSQSVYAAKYIAEGVSKTAEMLFEDGTSDDYAESLTLEEPELEAVGCVPESKYKIPYIIATAVISVFYFILINGVRWYRKKTTTDRVLRHLMKGMMGTTAADEKVSGASGTIDGAEKLAAKFGRRWLATTRRRKQHRMERRRDKLQQMSAQDHIMHLVKRLRNMSMQHVQELRTIIHDTRTGHERITRLVLVMSVLGAILVLMLLAATVAMLILWSRQVRLTFL